MSKWIDYDAIDYRNDRLHDKSEEFLNGVIYMAERIEEAPSIDIVRCKECKHGEYREEYSEYECHASGCGLVHAADFFCADGQKGDDTQTERSE